MIIGVSGKKQSGKDTVGKIIQYLNSYYFHHNVSKRNIILNGIENDYKNYLITHNGEDSFWEIKKFADKLKEIIALLIGCKKIQLEDEDFKNKKLGEEWWFYVNRHGEFAESYRNITKSTLNKWKKTSTFYKLIKPTPRFLLQFIGTNLFRDKLHPDIWVNSTIKDYSKNGLDWVITDLRFPNEFSAIKNFGGITIKVERPSINSVDTHISETALDNHTFDYTIINDGRIEDLIKKVKEVLVKENLL